MWWPHGWVTITCYGFVRPPKDFSRVKFSADPTKNIYKGHPSVYIMQNDHIHTHTLKIPLTTSKFVWWSRNTKINPASSGSVRIFRLLTMDTIWKVSSSSSLDQRWLLIKGHQLFFIFYLYNSKFAHTVMSVKKDINSSERVIWTYQIPVWPILNEVLLKLCSQWCFTAETIITADRMCI